jgi:hypothetical protein
MDNNADFSGIEKNIAEYAALISDFMKADTEIVNRDLTRIAGTGRFSGNAPVMSAIYRELFSRNGQVVISTPKRHAACASCPFVQRCLLAAEAAFPLMHGETAVFAIGIICESYAQKSGFIERLDSCSKIIKALSRVVSMEITVNNDKSQKNILNLENDFGEIRPMADIEMDAINHALNVCGNGTAGKKQAAKVLGIGVATLYRKLAGKDK